MESTKVEQGVNYLLAGMPDNILAVLSGVEIKIYATPQEAADALKTAIPQDAKGVFLGEPVVFEDVDEEQDEDDMQIVEGAKGVVALISGNLEPDEVPVVVLHELGHALDMDESDVEQLGLAVHQAIADQMAAAKTAAKEAEGAKPVQQPESGA